MLKASLKKFESYSLELGTTMQLAFSFTPLYSGNVNGLLDNGDTYGDSYTLFYSKVESGILHSRLLIFGF